MQTGLDRQITDLPLGRMSQHFQAIPDFCFVLYGGARGTIGHETTGIKGGQACRLPVQRPTEPLRSTLMTKRHWQASYGTIPTEINPEAHRSVVSMLEGAMQQFADKPAFRCLGQTVSYADVDRQSRAFAAYLQNKLGVRKGDRVAVMCPNLIAFPIAMLGIIRTGAAQVNVNPLYTPRELEYQLNDAGVNIIVVYSGVSATVAEVLAKTKLKTVITVGPGDGTTAKCRVPRLIRGWPGRSASPMP